MPVLEEIKNKSSVKYESVIPVGEIDRKFNDIVIDEEGNATYPIIADLRLIKTLDELKEFATHCVGVKIAVDTETTGLSYLSDEIVGFSVSYDAYSGIYVPIRHKHKKVFKTKENKLDENGEVMLTKTGKPRTHTVETYEFSEYEGNLDPKQALDVLYEIMLNAKFVLMHNSEFDMNMIKKEGYDVMKCRTFDTMLLPYIYDPEARLNGLKPLTKRLGRRVQDFAEVTGGEKEFQYTNPEESYLYAASDSANTYFIYEKLYPLVAKLLSEAPSKLSFDGKPYNVLMEDNNLIRAFIDYYGHVELKVDKKVAQDYKELIDKETAETVEKIYSYFGIGPFSLSTGSKEFKGVMKKFHMETGAKTKTGNNTSYGKEGIKEMNKNINLLKNDIWPNFNKISFIDSKLDVTVNTTTLNLSNYLKKYGNPYLIVDKKGVNKVSLRSLNNEKLSKEELKQLVKEIYNKEKKKLEILMLVLKYSSLMKALNSYVIKLTEVDSCRMRYRLTGTKSCRLSSGNGGKNAKDANDYYTNLNAQNLTKPKPQFYKAFQDNKEGNILGWCFEPVTDDYAHEHKEDEYIVEGTTRTANIRSCFVAPKGRYVASMDFSSQEIYIQSLLSKDPLLYNILLSGEDVHKATAIAIWGEEHYDKHKRRKAKACLGNNSKILTNRGLISPTELRKDDLIVDQYGNKQQYAKVMDYGKLIQITWSNGVVEDYTPEHEVKVITQERVEFKAIKDLTEEDQVLCFIKDGNVCEEFYVRCVNKIEVKGDIHVIETFTSHEYLTEATSSHNCNFLSQYMGGPRTLAEQLEIPFEEAKEILDKYNQAYHGVIQWRSNIIEAMYKNQGKIFTVFGRPRQLFPWLKMAHDTGEEGLAKYCERSCPSHMIQGMAGDICRRVLNLLYREFFKKRDPNIDFIQTVHDEVSYTINKDPKILVPYLKRLQEIMDFPYLDERLPIHTTIELGYSLGTCFPFVWTDENKTELVPKREH